MKKQTHEAKGLILDGVRWVFASGVISIIYLKPACFKCFMELDSYPSFESKTPNYFPEIEEGVLNQLICHDCKKIYSLPRTIRSEKDYVMKKIRSQNFKNLTFINIDDMAVPLAETKIKNEKYFVIALLTKSKIGTRLVVYAGEKGRKEKTQIFVEPKIKRLAFDQADLHPADVFTKLEATFEDGTVNSIKK